MDLDELTGLINTKSRISNIAPLIGTKFRNQRLLTKKQLLAGLEKPEQELVEWLYAAKPEEFGVKTLFYGVGESKDQSAFVLVERTLLNLNKEPVPDIQYVPKETYAAFSRLKSELFNDTSGQVEILSAYRSPAFQVLVICYWATRYEFNLNKTFHRVALPGYTEHGLIKDGAVDLKLGLDGTLDSQQVNKLAQTAEYKWLLEHAGQFGFRLSYPQDNELGMPFEPWHWRFYGN